MTPVAVYPKKYIDEIQNEIKGTSKNLLSRERMWISESGNRPKVA